MRLVQKRGVMWCARVNYLRAGCGATGAAHPRYLTPNGPGGRRSAHPGGPARPAGRGVAHLQPPRRCALLPRFSRRGAGRLSHHYHVWPGPAPAAVWRPAACRAALALLGRVRGRRAPLVGTGRRVVGLRAAGASRGRRPAAVVGLAVGGRLSRAPRRRILSGFAVGGPSRGTRRRPRLAAPVALQNAAAQHATPV